MVKVAPEATLWPQDPQEPVPSVPPSDKPTGPPPLRGPKGGLRRNLERRGRISYCVCISKKVACPLFAYRLTPYPSLLTF